MVEKAVRKTATKKTVRKTATKKAVSKTTSRRKAPTPVAKQKQQSQHSQRMTLVAIGIFILILGTSIFIGFSGDGQISINETITQQKEDATPEELNRIESVPVQQTRSAQPDGGLVPSGVPEEKVVPKPVATSTDSTASSSDATATSTDEVAEETSEDATEVGDTEEVIEPEIVEEPVV